MNMLQLQSPTNKTSNISEDDSYVETGDFFEDENETSGFMRRGNFVRMGDCRLVTKNFASSVPFRRLHHNSAVW
jgi:hypothetical protein